MIELELWGKSGCPNCDILKRNLAQAGIEYSYKNCDIPEIREEAIGKMIRSMPTVFIKKDMVVVEVLAGLKPTVEYTKHFIEDVHLEADLEYKDALNG